MRITVTSMPQNGISNRCVRLCHKYQASGLLSSGKNDAATRVIVDEAELGKTTQNQLLGEVDIYI